MTVIGYTPNKSYRNLLESLYKNHPDIELKLSSEPVPHSLIIEEISSASLAIIGYAPNAVNRNKIPTKLYEYVAANLPYLVQQNTLWSEVGGALGGAISINFNQPQGEITTKLESISKIGFAKSGYKWNEEQNNLRKFIDNILS